MEDNNTPGTAVAKVTKRKVVPLAKDSDQGMINMR
jgi:hypothetical protein